MSAITTELPRRAVGKTGVSVSILGFGGVQVGDYFVTLPEEVAIGAIAEAYASGIRYFDTAPRYGRGLSEHRIGHVLRGQRRDDFVLSTKVGRNLAPDNSLANNPDRLGLPFKFVPDLSYDGTMRGVEQSLHRLGLSRIDFVFIHVVERREHGDEYPAKFREAMDGCYRALVALREQKVINGIGAGINDADACMDLLRAADLDSLMPAGRYTLMEQHSLDDIMPLAAEKGVSIICGAPFNSGVGATGLQPTSRYGNKPIEPQVHERIRGVEAVCKAHGVEMAAAALQFPLAHPNVVTVVPGMASAAEVRRNVELLRDPIPADFWADLKARKLMRENALVPGRA